jgi:hypothetical protein
MTALRIAAQVGVADESEEDQSSQILKAMAVISAE